MANPNVISVKALITVWHRRFWLFFELVNLFLRTQSIIQHRSPEVVRVYNRDFLRLLKQKTNETGKKWKPSLYKINDNLPGKTAEVYQVKNNCKNARSHITHCSAKAYQTRFSTLPEHFGINTEPVIKPIKAALPSNWPGYKLQAVWHQINKIGSHVTELNFSHEIFVCHRIDQLISRFQHFDCSPNSLKASS